MAGFDVLVQMPLTLDDDSETEPDLAVVRGHASTVRPLCLQVCVSA